MLQVTREAKLSTSCLYKSGTMISILLVKHEVREKDGAKCNKQTLLSNDANTFCG